MGSKAYRPKFNFTNQNIDWAKFSWNPYTGCLHGCPYCYARDIAHRFYKERFEPTFHPERLEAPSNTRIPKSRVNEPGIRNVFVCSMGDLSGHWVEQSHIDQILDVVRRSPQWTYLFLTKNPRRMMGIDWPANSWVGTTVDVQARVGQAEEAFMQIEAPVRFVSCEPLLEEIQFSNLEIFDWVIIGARSRSTRLPEFQPELEWVKSLILQAREADCKVYCKPNLKVALGLVDIPKDYPETGEARQETGRSMQPC